MDTTIRNLDEAVYRALRSYARKKRLTVGETVTEALRAYLLRPEPTKSGSIRDLVPEAWPEGNEHSSEEIDITVYDTILLRPHGPAVSKLSWAETAEQIATARENWDARDTQTYRE